LEDEPLSTSWHHKPTGGSRLAKARTSARTFADAGTDVGVIRELAGHADIRTTTIYTAVDDARLEHAIAERGRQNRGARRAAAGA
jgi:integrase